MAYLQIKQLKKQVGVILNDYPHTRNDDAALVKLVCDHFGYADQVSKVSSIERCRRWYNSKRQYLPTDERVAKARRLNIDEWRIALGFPTQASAGTGQPDYTPQSLKLNSTAANADRLINSEMVKNAAQSHLAHIVAHKPSPLEIAFNESGLLDEHRLFLGKENERLI